MDREKIAILGGGMASLSAAMGLTSRPELRARYEITVYQDGWLLGGKGASVRNRARNHRIEEHGLHLLLGFYENAFGVIRRAYQELGRPPGAPLATFEQAFRPECDVVLEERTERGWEHWVLRPPANSLVPGDGRELPSLGECVELGLAQMRHHVRSLQEESRRSRPERGAVLDKVLAVFDEALAWLSIALAATSLSAGVVSRQGVKSAIALAAEVGGARTSDDPRVIDGLVTGALRRAWQLVEREIARDAALRRLWILLEFQAVNVLGMIREGLLVPDADFAALDDVDYRVWMKRHGASELTVSSALVQGLYNLAFSASERAGAGTALLGSIRMLLAYRGGVFWKMQAGMGEAVFAPLYEVLRRRGVRFRFFHRVRALGLSADRRALSRVEIGVQATVKDGRDYEPLIDVGGLPCWPEAPLFEQLVEGDALAARGAPRASWWSDAPDVERCTLERGRDFDRAILGISIGALPSIAGELIEASPRFRAMVERVGTIKTVAVQLWLDPDAAAAGWPLDPRIVGTYAPPFETWADMTHLLPRERWSADRGPRSLAYLCGTLDDAATPCGPDDAARDGARVDAMVRAWLSENCAHLVPRVSDAASGALDWSALHDPEGRVGEARLAAQYVRVNVDPSDRYVLSLPGTTRHRLRADESGFEGLYLAGDWTRTGLDAGCIEAAAMSGLQASRAICGSPERVYGEAPRPRPAAPSLVELPRYVERAYEQALRAPYLLERARLTALAFRAELSALRVLLDRCLNAPSGGAVRYVPAAPLVMLLAMHSEHAYSTDPAHRPWGHAPESDIAFWIPALRIRAPEGAPLSPRLVWFLPYVFVDNLSAMASGRELYGFHKSFVELDLQQGERGLSRLAVRGQVIERFRPETLAGPGQILSVERVGPDPRMEAAASVVRALSAIGVPDSLTRLLPGSPLDPGPAPVDGNTLVFLKQIRDVEQMDRACYQAVVEAPAIIRGLRRWGFEGGAYRAKWTAHDSHPYVEELGLHPGEQESLFATFADFDFEMKKGRVIWSATDPRFEPQRR